MSILLAIGIGLLAANVIIKPIVLTAELLKEVTGGDFSHEHKVDDKGEIGEMLKAYNGMIGGLRVYVHGTMIVPKSWFARRAHSQPISTTLLIQVRK